MHVNTGTGIDIDSGDVLEYVQWWSSISVLAESNGATSETDFGVQYRVVLQEQ